MSKFIPFTSSLLKPYEHMESMNKSKGRALLQALKVKVAPALIPILVFLLVFAVYFSNKNNIPTSDSMWAVHIAMSVIREGNTTLDEYVPVLTQRDNYAVHEVGGHWRSNFPLGTPLLAVPVLFAVDQLFQWGWSFDLYKYLQLVQDDMALYVELFVASLIAALACVVAYGIGRLSLSRSKAVVLALLLAFCTSLWSTASRGLWQHGPSVLMLSLALYLMLAARERPPLIQFVSLPLAWAYLIRPTNSIPIFFITLWVLWVYRPYFLKYLLWSLPIALPFLTANLLVYDHILPPYYLPQRLSTTTHTFLEALAGNLISPARGLLVFSPIILFAAYGLFLKVRRQQFRKLDVFLLAILFFHWLAISSFPHWWAGHSYGPRLFTDMLPFLIYFLIPVLAAFTRPLTLPRWALAVLFVLMALGSGFIHFRGATSSAAVTGWNREYAYIVANVDRNPERLWDWSDPQFLRGLRPANLSLSQSKAYISRFEDSDPQMALRVILSNVGDQDLRVEIKTPPKVELIAPQAEQEWLLLGMGSRELFFVLDSAAYDVGVHSLGGIAITATAVNGRAVQNNPLVLPVGIEIMRRTSPPPLPDLPHHAFFPLLVTKPSRTLFVPPAGISINGQPQHSSGLQAVYGTGWPTENTETAELYIFTPHSTDVTLQSTFTRLMGVEQGVLQITANEQKQIAQAVQVQEPFAVPVMLDAGWNLLTLSVSPAADANNQQIKFALGAINISAE